ncbi:MAG: hypothetical protein L0J79_01600 [Propionibacterium sp.]|nr:hypothetical protein [Propionibacterium sp.]
MTTTDPDTRHGSSLRGFLAQALPSTGATVALGTALLLAALILLVRGGGEVLHAPTVWLFGIGLALLPLAGLWWVVGPLLHWVVGRRRREVLEPAGLALREGAMWSFWLGWVLLILFQPLHSLSDGGLAAPWVRVCVVALVVAGVVGRALRLDECDRLAAGLGYGKGSLGRALFLVSSVLLGLLTVACLFMLIISVGSGFNSPVPTI